MPTVISRFKGPLIVLIMLLALAAIAYLRFGSLGIAVAYFRGHTLHISPATYELTSPMPNGSGEIAFTAVNLGSEPVTVLGGTSNCSCTVAQGLPLDIPAGESRDLRVMVAYSADDSSFDETVTFYTTAARDRELIVRIVSAL